MVFSSMTFVIFFLPVVMGLYFLNRNATYRNIILLVFSLLFYAWGEPKWIFVMLLTVSTNYLCGLLVSSSKRREFQRLWMLLGVGLSLGFLFYFKYFGFVLDSVTALLGVKHSYEAPVLPIGISFYTFQVLTYVVDVYRGKVACQKSFLKLLLYVSFFPQLIAGPIVNYKDIEASLDKRSITLEDYYQGFLRFLIGFSKKILIANTCGEITAKMSEAGELSVAGAWLVAVAYTLQIYFDFSGYSDMAIGMGRMFGFRFLENFRYPYLSSSVTDFWRRWHISLGSFFREYVYIPLGGNRVSVPRQIFNIFVVWILTGIWHGASWNFVIWGVYYGVLLILEKQFFWKVKERLPEALNVAMTFLPVVVGWVLFYYVDLGQGIRHLAIMFGLGGVSLTDAYAVYYFKHYAFFLACGFLASVPWKEVWAQKKGMFGKFLAENACVQKVLYIGKPFIVTLLFLLSMGLLVGQSYNPFLYFRF